MPENYNELQVEQLRHTCDPNEFKFANTGEIEALENIIGQDRALGAVSFGVEIKSHGYHMFALGPTGTGKTTTIHKYLVQDARKRPVPDDWLYVNNFEDPDKPRAIRLPAGKGRELTDDLDNLVEELKTEVPGAFESKEYKEEQQKLQNEYQEKGSELFQKLHEKARERNFRLMQSPQGLILAPVREGEALSPDQVAELNEDEQKKIEEDHQELEKEMRETMHQVEQIQKEGKERSRELDRRVIGFAVDHLINELKEKYSDFEQVVEFLTNAKDNLLKNVQTFKQIKQMEEAPEQKKMAMTMISGGQQPSFDEYRGNLLVDNSKTEGAPVIYEKNPIGPNLIGRIEHQGQFGTLVTNFRMIKNGSLQRANGGYLIIDAFDLLSKPLAWQVMKRSLRNEEVFTESMGEVYGMMTTRTLEPEPIPLNIKVVLIGDPLIYYMLYHYDFDFQELFKVKADFDTRMDWEQETPQKIAQFISMVCREEDLRHFAPGGVAKVVEHGARQASHQQKLSTKFGDIVDLVRQASYWSGKNGNEFVEAGDVQKAIDQKIYRSNRIEERLREMISEGTILIDTRGEANGQVNGLSVLPLGDYMFGKPSRITARTSVGTSGVVNIDREAKLSGPIYNKGTMILAGYLGQKYATEMPMAISASIAFEQLYEGIEGDSAASAELYALLSSLSGYPLRQDLAVTGSVNQHGEIQAIGGVNEKIEGFFRVCKLMGLNDKQGVIIPQSNMKHLMLNEEIIEAVEQGQFHIYAVSSIEEGIELLTGVEAGVCREDGIYPENTVNRAVQERINDLAAKAKDFGGGGGQSEKKDKD
ncbi:MAG: Lon protease family protein [Desulfurivibrionaceae bacterium]